ncbi:MAG TPA: AarF/UbiB family protein [Gaiellaceae bacterium]|nr:AarF/UbiB family protein [Gaiellaceae bacterium]
MTEVEGQLLGRALRIGRVLAKYGLRERSGDGSLPERAASLRAALEELGPTFAKLGQILSTRPDLLPPEFVAELEKLQDDVPPLTEAEVVLVMEQELGVPWEDVFESIDPKPLAAGTIGQVHRATLESGERVVAKVQRPDAAEKILRDLGLLELFAEKTEERDALRRLVDIPAVIDHLSESLRRELDFRQELSNVERLREVLAPYPRLAVPGVYEQLSSSRLLVLEFVDGVPIRHAPATPERKEAARQLIESYYRQILTDGFFHADPHPGNLLWCDGRVYFLDAGMVGELEPRIRELVLLLVMAFWQEDDEFLSEIMLQLSGGRMPQDLDLDRFQGEIGELFSTLRGQSLKEIQLGPVMEGLTQIAARHDVRMPASLALTGKALAQMQLAAAELDPGLDPFSVIGRYLLRTFFEQFAKGLDPKRAFYEAQKLKVRATRFVESIERIAGSRPGMPFQVEFRGTAPLEDTIRRATRRLAIAGMAAASTVGAAITATSSSAPEWIPSVLGGVAAALSVALVGEFLRRR